jgi:hypothetical protein
MQLLVTPPPPPPMPGLHGPISIRLATVYLSI